MHILYVHQYFTFPSNAGGTRSYDLSQRFIAAGHKVTVITTSAFLKQPEALNEKWTVMERDGITLHILNLEYSNKDGFAKRVKAFMNFMSASTKKLLELDGDVVLATSTPLTIAVPALIKKFRHSKPFIFEVRDVWPEAPIAIGAIRNKAAIALLNSFERYTYKKSKHIVALSDDMKSSILRRTNMPDAKVSVIPNISELNRFSNYTPGANFLQSILGFQPKKSLLYAGTIGKANRIQFMIDIAVCVQKLDEEIKFLIMGDGSEKEHLVKYAEEKGVLNKNLYFLNPIPKAKLPQLYSEVTVASSFYIGIQELWANSANKFFDTLAAGKPVLINYEGWQANMIRKYNAGFVFDYRDENITSESERFVEYINDEALLKLQGLMACKMAEENYSLDKAADQYLKILNDVV